VCDEIRERLEAGVLELPPLPRVVAEITEAIDGDRGHAQLAQIVRSDPAMAANVMRLANSAAYRRGRRIETLQQAIALLGQDELVEMAISICARAQLFCAPGLEDLVDRLWLEALVAGLWARQLARRVRGNVESAYLCGLLHTIGKPIVLRELAGLTDADQAEALIDQLHVEVGHRAGKEWKLPAPVEEAILYYREPSAAPGRGLNAQLAAVTENLVRYTFDREIEIDRERFAGLGLYPTEVDALLELCDELLKQARELATRA
jgi:HD-like signal output (HDOD) protein